jgi:twitching motility protein PilT
MQVGQARFGMQTMNQALFSLVQHHQTSLEEAMERSYNLDEFQQMSTALNLSSLKK